jgi:hypothetical protein
MIWLSENLCIFSNAAEALVRQIKHNAHGHGTYLLGQDRPSAFWYYFPVVLSIKLTVPTLAGLAVLAVSGRRGLMTWVGACALVLFAFSLNCRVQIGVRLVLPLVAMLTVTLAVGLAHFAGRCLAGRLLAAGVVGWSAGIAVMTWPHGLTYVNDFWGGPGRAHELVSDSNCDWGQGLYELQHWQADHSAPLRVWYFGTDPLIHSGPWLHTPLHILPLESDGTIQPEARGGHLAVGKTLVYGHALTESHRRAAAYLRTQTPIASTTTFLIYRLD